MTAHKIYTRFILFFLGLTLPFYGARAQATAYSTNFLASQRSNPRISEVLIRKEDTLRRQFQQKGLVWPAKYIYIRSFKYDSELELWVKNKASEKFKLFKTYKICALAGSLGPKRMAGDYQVPEGFYYINEFNPHSLYHLSLGLNYPNASDRLLSDLSQPGGDIYIHGSCVTTGCIPITDDAIEELYVLAAHAKDQGQDFIPVHIFPIDFRNPHSVAYLNRYLLNFAEYGVFERNMKNAFNYFERNHQIPVVLVNDKGEYVMEEVQPPAPVEEVAAEVKQPEKKVVHRDQPIKEDDLATVVDRLPVYPGGNEGFRNFVDKLSKDMLAELQAGQRKTFVLVEFIVDGFGKTIYANVLSGGNDGMNEKIVDAFMKIPGWVPATRSGKNVPIKLKQTIMIGVD
jgi:murein L,D-transpeptidase YafK